MNRKRVLHLVQSSHFSGAESVACKIIDSFKGDKGFEVAYCSRDGSINDVLLERNIKHLKIEKISINEIRKIIDTFQPDIIHAHDGKASVLSALCSKKAKVISHLHSNASWIKKISLNSFLYLIASFKFKKILTVSESIEKEYVFSKFLRKKFMLIRNPVDIEDIIERAKININKNFKTDIMYIGRLSKEKNPILFINIIFEIKKHYPNIKACMIGEGILWESCMDEIKALNLEENITMTGFLKNPYSLLKETKVLCMTSNWEGYGLVAVEALALGKPVICKNVGGLPNLVNDSCGKCCDTKEQIIEELVNLLKDKNKYQEKSSSSRIQANLLNNISSYKELIKNIYYSVYGRENEDIFAE
ncbi:glycosyltransferase [uncultured Ilyobacter sp.]|uniref:glycosyltransferase n=1 Tax=uncultured Ilyobacter sp. TaxID=544433 RepID=UPI0029C7E366|nr:glycosyltransferase [uncultured Ilyobacter sp.]